MVTIQVFRTNTSKPVEGAKVDIYWGFGNSYGRDGKTDATGTVHLDMDAQDGKVVINGTKVHQGRISGRHVFYI